MSELTTQINAILTAPIPFFVAFIVVAGFTLTAAWRAFEWRYRAEIEKTKSNFELSRSEIQILAQIAARKEADLNETLSKQAEEIEGLKKQLDARAKLWPEKGQLPDELREALAKLSDTTINVKYQAGELGKANNAIADASQSFWLDRRIAKRRTQGSD
jgi:hypothetical protein